MSYEDLARLKQVSASMAWRRPRTARAARRAPLRVRPETAVRLRTIEDAGRLAIPFTTGILVGIGTRAVIFTSTADTPAPA